MIPRADMLSVVTILLGLVGSVQLTPVLKEVPEKLCQYGNATFKLGESLTSDACDRCFCTQYGVMCELLRCPEETCHDAVMGKCCMECPNGPNCLHSGPHGTVLVPRDGGCQYSPGLICYCYHDKQEGADTRALTWCFPALPGDDRPGVRTSFFGDLKPKCVTV
ncbi:brorin-like isoform X2 [Dreissena polymorpha]|uniref:brorin-like isoform X2 n=1 Tax=Dreissena polymorpha TaxID=45954 RepID=UPI00226561CB|nr:brorin-like isoform X2 [Dreissena polymorpha]